MPRLNVLTACAAVGMGMLSALSSGPALAQESQASQDYEDYLSRLKTVCEVECLQPRDLLRQARKRKSSDTGDMAIIMDVAYIARVDGKFQLFNINRETSFIDDLINLGSAGVDTSQRSGIGGRSRGNRNVSPGPNTIIIEINDLTVLDMLNRWKLADNTEADQSGEKRETSEPTGEDAAGIVVQGDRDAKTTAPTVGELNRFLRNRRIVARGEPRLEVVFTGGRRDYRRKQVTLQLDDAGDLGVLPSYDDDGNAVLDGPLARLAEVVDASGGGD